MARSTAPPQPALLRRACLASALAVAIFWAGTLAASPGLHELVHPDAGDEDHDCAVTLFLSGAFGLAGTLQPFVVPVVLPPVEFCFQEFSSPFRSTPRARFILEHGPPAQVLS